MYPTSTQYRFWLFKNEEELITMRAKANKTCREKLAEDALKPAGDDEYFLNPVEEHALIMQKEIDLQSFCRRVQPPMPNCVIGTAHHLLKRIYLNNSAINYHPKDIMITIVFLACKIEEFNISLEELVKNIKGDRAKAKEIILSNELLVLELLKYQIFVHNPYRAVEGFLIDVKVRSGISLEEKAMREHIDSYLRKSLLTDVCLLYTPSQIAMSAVLHAAKATEECLDEYVMKHLYNGEEERLKELIAAVRNIRLCVHNYKPPDPNSIKKIEKKLEICRNQLNNPDSEVYRDRMRRLYADEENFEGSFHVADSSMLSNASNED